jgi:hydroxymethylpyrimidine pyrophosphatase-like HAD family hydrolase
MLEYAGIGVAMGNAIPEIKQIADITVGSNDDDGVANYLIDYFQISPTAIRL